MVFARRRASLLILNALAGAGCAGTDEPALDQQHDTDVAVDVVSVGGTACAEAADATSAGRFESWDRGEVWLDQPSGQLGDDGGWGVAVDDFNGDGRLDVFLPHWDGGQLFVANEAGGLDDASAGLPESDDHVLGVVAGDLDGDGDIDLVLANEGPDAVWVNDGDGGFTALRDALGGGPTTLTHSISLGDFNGDGVLDVFGATGFGLVHGDGREASDFEPQRNKLLFGLGDGTFENADALLPDVEPLPSNMAGFFDVNGDGHLDIYITADKADGARRSEVYLGDSKGGLVHDPDPGGLNVIVDGMGIGEGDLNGDGVADYAISGWGEMVLMVSAADGWFAESALPLGLVTDPERVVAWGTEFVDLDLDSDLDVLVAYGPDYDTEGVLGGGPEFNPHEQSWGYYRNGDGVFEEVSAERGLWEAGNRRGFVAADLDGDGHLDLVARDLAHQTTLHHGVCTDRAWLTVQLEQPDSPNWRAIGARIDVETPNGVQPRWIRAGSTNISSSSPPVAHFGLADLAEIDGLTVTWPDGAVSQVGALSSRQHVTLTRR